MSSNTYNNEIPWKRYPIEVEHWDIMLKGMIEYWSKDYKVILSDPVCAESKITHMMFMIPARFTTTLDKSSVDNIKNVDIVEASKEKLKQLFDENCYDYDYDNDV